MRLRVILASSTGEDRDSKRREAHRIRWMSWNLKNKIYVKSTLGIKLGTVVSISKHAAPMLPLFTIAIQIGISRIH